MGVVALQQTRKIPDAATANVYMTGGGGGDPTILDTVYVDEINAGEICTGTGVGLNISKKKRS